MDIKTTLLTITVLLVSQGSGCFIRDSGYRSNLEQYKEYINQADTSIQNENYLKAEEQTKSALKLAQKMKWHKGIIMATSSLGKLYQGNKKYHEAEVEFNQIKAMCRKGLCQPEDLGSVLDSLFLLYLNGFKDISKSQRVIEEVILDKEFLSADEKTELRLAKYVTYLKHFGYEKEAKELEERIKTIQ